TFLFSQTGPGGIGNTSSNVLWLQAGDITGLNDGDDISSWIDNSGNSNDVSQPNSSYTPIYKTNILNGYPIVRFNKTNGRIRKTNFAQFPTTAITEIYVNKNSESSDGILSYASTASNNDFLLYSSNSLNIYRGSNVGSGIGFNNDTWHIADVSWQSSNGSAEVWKDGAQGFSTTGFQTGTSITANGCLAIAGEQDAIDGSYASNQAHFGDFAEVIVYNTYLNDAQRIIVANYLAAKYNLTISNDRYAYQGTHPYNVAGIGRANVSNTHTAAMSAGILQIQNPSGLNVNNEYLLFGHDNGDITSWTTTEAPNSGTNIQRLAREWRLDETGSVGTVDFIIDVADLPAQPAGNPMYALMIDNDGNFSNGAKVYEMTLVSGTQYTVTGINVNNGNFVAIACVNPKVQHTLIASDDYEPNNAVIEVSLNFIPRTNKTVDYTTSDGTALASQPDYIAASGTTLTIPAGNNSADYTINITNDVVVENDEDFTITLSNPSAGLSLGTNITHTYTIHDDDNGRKIYFNTNASNGDESVSPVTVTVSINNVDAVNPTTVDYSVTGGTATGGGIDYTLISGTVTIPAGSSSGTFNITINDDALYESNETIIVSLSNPTNCNLDGVLPYGGTGFIDFTYTINDNDTPPEIQFTATSSSGSESTSPVNFQVELSAVSEVDAQATYTVTGTATGGGVDYTLANGTITIPAGSTTANITATITNDNTEELNETIILTLSSPVDATLGTNITHTYTIIDDDEFGDTGPGGVGKNDNNILWVKSDDLTVVADGTDITTWSDASGNSNDLSQTNTSYTPRYYSNVLNSKPVVRFEQSNGRLIRNSFTDFPTNAITTIFVNKNGDSGDGVVSYASSASDNNYLLFNSSNIGIYRNSNVNSGTAINGNTWRIVNNTWQASDGNTRLYRNGTQNYSGTITSGSSITAGGNLAIAGEQDGVNSGYSSSQSHQGDFTEIIIYNIVLNSAQRKIVDNYLSSKYNIAIANDMYSYDASGTYENDVIGIGRDDANNFHLSAHSTDIKINNPSNLDNGEFLLCGNNRADFTSDGITDFPTGIQARVARTWAVDEQGSVGSVDITFYMDNNPVTNDLTKLRLLIDDDGNFSNGGTSIITPSSTNAVANTVTFTNDFSAAKSIGNYFSLGSIDKTTAPLPVELLSFTGKLNGSQVDLLWETASEINNDYFTIERSDDAISFESIGRVDGKGNYNGLSSYSLIDFNPLTGISYYRLKQTDFDGKFSYSNIVSINYILPVTVIQPAMKLFPNPATNGSLVKLEMTGMSADKEVLVVVTNVLGQQMYSKVILTDQNGQIMVAVDPHNQLSPGTYVIVAASNDKLLSKRLIIQ
ncbi:MAG: T9SS type A sorting domain-containing protein, partial [Bacteroidales bacterium]|nr:T9SS type A sorting domain-containing protein [Bacteroidales bacterium]